MNVSSATLIFWFHPRLGSLVSRGRDLRRSAPSAQAVDRCRAPVAQGAPRPGGEDRSVFPSEPWKGTITDCVDASVDRVQPPGADTSIDRGFAEAERAELGATHDAVLLLRDSRDPTLHGRFARFPSTIEGDVAWLWHSWQPDRRNVICGALNVKLRGEIDAGCAASPGIILGWLQAVRSGGSWRGDVPRRRPIPRPWSSARSASAGGPRIWSSG